MAAAGGVGARGAVGVVGVLDELAAIHGADERVSIRALEAAVEFHRSVLTGA